MKSKETNEKEVEHEHSSAKPKTFNNSGRQKDIEVIDAVMGLLYLVTALCMLIGVPVIGYMIGETIGVLVGLLVVAFPTYFLVRGLIYRESDWKLQELYYPSQQIIKIKAIQLTVLGLLNFVVILKIGFNTLMPLWLLPASLCSLFGIGLLVSYLLLPKLSVQWMLIGIAPGVLAMFLLINYSMSNKPVSETYRFTSRWKKEITGRSGNYERQDYSYIDLEGNAYANYQGIRIFFDYEQMKYAKTITYTFEDGFFGLRVVKDYKFNE